MLVILRQAKENKIRRLSPAEAIRCLYPETLIHRWSRNDVEKSISLLSMLATEIPVFRLECRPDAESVQVLKQALLNLYQEGV